MDKAPFLSTRSFMQRLLKEYAFAYKGLLLLGLVGMVVLSVASVAPAKLIEDVVNHIFVAKNSSLLMPITLLIVLAFFLKGAATYGAHLALDYVGQRIVAALQRDLFNRIIELDLDFFHHHPLGDLVSRLVSDVTKLQNAVTGTLSSLIKDTLTSLFFIGLMFYQDWILASIAIMILPLAFLPLRKIGRRIRKTSNQVQENTGVLTVFASQAFHNMRLIKAYSLESFEKSRLAQAISQLVERQFKTTRLKTLNHPVMEFLGGLAIAVIILYGGNQVIEGQQTPGAFFSFIAALMMVYEPLKRLANLNANLQEQMAAGQRVFSLIDKRPLIQEKPSALTRVEGKGGIVFKGVTFSYKVGQPVLKDLCLSFEQGKRIALVGPSGGGKSTIFNLMLRLYDPQEGEIFLGQEPLKNFSLNALRSHMALVSQEAALFDGTIEDNIRLGSLDASRDAIKKAAQKAAAHNFIKAFPQQYQTLVGERGVLLSGGQRQRIAIARAMLKDAPFLLLDEPTSALDADSEAQVQEALQSLMSNRTTVMIAHRLSTIKDADIIYVIDQGQLRDQGSFAQLQQTSPVFRQWLENQSFKNAI